MAESQELSALDQFDLKLLAALEADGRLTNAELGEKIGLSASQCSRRRIRLEESGIIEGYHARLNGGRLGIGLRAFIQVSLSPHSKENAKMFRDFVNGVEEIQEAYALTGDADYLLRVAARDLSGLAHVINDLILPQANVAHVKSSIVLSKLKDSHRLPLKAAKPAA
ncbi:MAG: Lrp/AsnC family transcriptional regulator [Beijerinckiaceae bacterium]|nr:Lrp/AsnC family transcriptional regulator [Beijerinckiaceae bacterium]MCI0735619.1 Lrp/AsnC family transcriptional regulator [Beijerinckiaceae bacterium]